MLIFNDLCGIIILVFWQKDLAQLAGISTSTITKMKNNENVTTGVLLKICEALHCGVEDIIEFVDDCKSERGV